ncbi:hypothetical protein CN498_20560 [Bacillus thuringiensis]|uniref:Uncharacterized protein n=1 Tax=Bacillus cereus (strain G9842) TaxID=405531 RepID=B7IKJ3_BACC2|nr:MULTISPECIES: hypothetical protein [Bacillus cereus group]ACK96268.1 hypothetical protein BCG9842_B2379 [Bacillus cereus G9842]MDR4134413.1 hypothetical protein [Bacillus cereus]MDR4366375.1 hypothetical protein [Bacillus cereus]PER85594.1 hypothetical protein CN498_20560 [Bacillus thuringiensis]PGS34986.1 hypothetical protein COC65_20675 [Bacillus thuringiensis]
MTNEKFLNEQIEKLKEVANYSTDPCIVATSIAVSSQKVIDLILKKLNHGDIYRGHHCSKHTTNWELVYVIFDFDCPPGVFCLIRPSFAAVVNMVTHSVEIIDPYIESHINSLQTVLKPERAGYKLENEMLDWPLPKKHIQLTLSNHTGMDIHVQVTDKADWGPGQLNHAQNITASTREAYNFGNRANFHVQVWKNDNGQQGKFIGEFDHHVRYNALGWTDALEFVIREIDGQVYMFVVSLRVVGEVIARYLLSGE